MLTNKFTITLKKKAARKESTPIKDFKIKEKYSLGSFSNFLLIIQNPDNKF